MSTAPINILLDKVDYKQVRFDKPKGNIPYVTHEGTLILGGISIIVCQLNTGERIIPEEEFKKIFGEDWKEFINPIL